MNDSESEKQCEFKYDFLQQYTSRVEQLFLKFFMDRGFCFSTPRIHSSIFLINNHLILKFSTLTKVFLLCTELRFYAGFIK